MRHRQPGQERTSPTKTQAREQVPAACLWIMRSSPVNRMSYAIAGRSITRLAAGIGQDSAHTHPWPPGIAGTCAPAHAPADGALRPWPGQTISAARAARPARYPFASSQCSFGPTSLRPHPPSPREAETGLKQGKGANIFCTKSLTVPWSDEINWRDARDYTRGSIA
jgi:hypothetical protein